MKGSNYRNSQITPGAKTASRLCCALCVVAGAGYFLFVRRAFPQGGAAFFAFHGLFALAFIALGLSLLFYYPYKRYGFLHNAITLFFIYLGFILAFWCNSALNGGVSRQKAVITACAAVFLALTLWKLSFKDVRFIRLLPLAICNIVVVFIIVRPFLGHPVFDNYTICIGIIAGILNYFVGPWFGEITTKGFFHYRAIESTLMHALFFSYSIFSLMTGSIRVNTGTAMMNMLWLIPAYILLSFLNQIWKTDYFFTGVYGDTPPFLVKLYRFWPLQYTVRAGGRSFEVNVVHSALLISFVAVMLLLVSTGLAALQRSGAPDAFLRAILL